MRKSWVLLKGLQFVKKNQFVVKRNILYVRLCLYILSVFFFVCLQKADPTQFMQIHSRKCKIHLDPAVAAAGDSPAIMQVIFQPKANL